MGVVFSYSKALFTKKVEGNKVEWIVGDFSYQLESSALDEDYSITVGPGERKQFNITLSSFNEKTSKYALYYQFITKLSEEEKNQIEIGYLDTTQHPTSGVIDTNESVMITIKIVNHSNKEVEIAFGAEGGLENNEIIVTKGIAIDHVMHGSDIILAATLDGSPLEEFPKREDNYGVKSVSCSDGAVGTFKTSNWSFIVEDFVRSETECVVDFSKDITIDETSPIITSTKEEMNQEITEGKSSIVDALAAME